MHLVLLQLLMIVALILVKMQASVRSGKTRVWQWESDKS